MEYDPLLICRIPFRDVPSPRSHTTAAHPVSDHFAHRIVRHLAPVPVFPMMGFAGGVVDRELLQGAPLKASGVSQRVTSPG
jgi:hypothetical protein